MMDTSFIPLEYQKKYSFLIDNPKSLDQKACANLLFDRIKEKYGEENGIVTYFGYGRNQLLGSNTEYSVLRKIANGNGKPYTKSKTIVLKWIGHCENKHRLINEEDLKKNFKKIKLEENESDSIEIENLSSKNGLEFETLWDEINLAHQNFQEDINLMEYDIRNRFTQLLPRVLGQNNIGNSFGVTPYFEGAILINLMHDFDTREIKDEKHRTLIAELMHTFDKLLGVQNGNEKHIFLSSKDQTEKKSKAQSIFNELVKNKINISLNKTIRKVTLNSPPIINNYVPHRELNIIPTNKEAADNQKDLHDPNGASSYRFMCKIIIETIIDVRFGNKTHYQPKHSISYDHLVDKHLSMQIDDLMRVVNSKRRFNPKVV